MPQLTPHPDSPCAAVAGIEAQATRPGPGLLMLRYVMRGSVDEVRLAARTTPARADGLWRHTCFEAFVAADEGYYEFNFSPSGEWAAYRFDGYRDGLRQAEVGAPKIEMRRAADSFELHALLDLGGLPDGPWRVGLSAVIEKVAGGVSYWALAHPPGRPDFHHADCFALELPETARP
jgi:hypothetical protein